MYLSVKALLYRPDPETVSKGNAKVLMGGTWTYDNGACGNAMNFMFGRNPQTGEIGWYQCEVGNIQRSRL